MKYKILRSGGSEHLAELIETELNSGWKLRGETHCVISTRLKKEKASHNEGECQEIWHQGMMK